MTLTNNRGFFMTLGNAECSQTLAKQTTANPNMIQSYNQFLSSKT